MRNPRRPRILAVLVTALLLVAGACGGGGDDRSTTREPTGGASGEGGGDGSGVEIVERGSEPRETLRFALAPGSTFRSRMTVGLGITMTIDGQTFPATAIPATEALLSGTVEEVVDGRATYRFTMEEVRPVPAPGIDPAVVAQMEQALTPLQGVTGTGSVDDRGNAGESTLDTSGITDPAMKATLDSITSQVGNLTVPFPEESVGVGGSWRAERRAVLNGVTTDTTSTYTLKSRNGSSYVLDIVQDVTAPKGEVDIPGVPPAAKAEIVSYDARNTGTITGELTSLLPIESGITGSGDIEMRVTEDGSTSELVQKLTIDLRLARA